jgi:hypothetical protein
MASMSTMVQIWHPRQQWYRFGIHVNFLDISGIQVRSTNVIDNSKSRSR